MEIFKLLYDKKNEIRVLKEELSVVYDKLKDLLKEKESVLEDISCKNKELDGIKGYSRKNRMLIAIKIIAIVICSLIIYTLVNILRNDIISFKIVLASCFTTIGTIVSEKVLSRVIEENYQYKNSINKKLIEELEKNLEVLNSKEKDIRNKEIELLNLRNDIIMMIDKKEKEYGNIEDIVIRELGLYIDKIVEKDLLNGNVELEDGLKRVRVKLDC